MYLSGNDFFSIPSTMVHHLSLFPLFCRVNIFLTALSMALKAIGLINDSENTGSEVHVL